MVGNVLSSVYEVNKQINTVTAVAYSSRCDENGEETMLAPVLDKLNYSHFRAKTDRWVWVV